jgi:hypothetical protein
MLDGVWVVADQGAYKLLHIYRVKTFSRSFYSCFARTSFRIFNPFFIFTGKFLRAKSFASFAFWLIRQIRMPIIKELRGNSIRKI